jgi:hypothetical protein
MTAPELTALGAAIEKLLAPYRRESRPGAPAEARPVSAMIRMLPG